MTISLSSCVSIPWPARDAERCGLFINKVEIEGRELWEGKCRCHDYRISRKTVGRVSDSIDHPVEYCKRLVGFRPLEWTDVFVSWFDDLRIYDQQNKKATDSFVQGMIDDNP